MTTPALFGPGRGGSMLMLLLLKSVTAGPLEPPERLEMLLRTPASVAVAALMTGDMMAGRRVLRTRGKE